MIVSPSRNVHLSSGTQILLNVLISSFALVFGALAACVRLDVLVQQLVGVQFGAVAGEKSQRHAALVRRQPALHPFPVMHRVTVQDQEHLSFHRTQQAAQERQQHRLRESLLEHHERSVPRLVIVEFMLQPKRCPVPAITGVRPRLL